MVYYVEMPQARKTGVLGYYLLLCLIGVSVFLSPTGNIIPIHFEPTRDRINCLADPDMGGGGVTNCGNGPCHPNQYGNWSLTGHATHISQYNSSHVMFSDSTIVSYVTFDSDCAECHTSGYDNNTGTYDSLGINCLVCHDASWSAWSDYSGALCSQCHRPAGTAGPHQHLAFQNSDHVDSLNDLRASVTPVAPCMRCHSTESFIHYRNPGMLADDTPNIDTNFDPFGDYNPIGCSACHSVHANWSGSSPSMIRANSSAELCILCHSGGQYPVYEIWNGSSHHLAGVECTDCHGYNLLLNESGSNWVPFLNHTFSVDPEVACGQQGCHDGGLATWALGQLEMIQDSFDALTDEILLEADELQDFLNEYNGTDYANITTAEQIQQAIDNARNLVERYRLDKSRGLHNQWQIFQDLNAVYNDLVAAEAHLTEVTFLALETERVTVTVTVTKTVTEVVTVTKVVPPPESDSRLVISGLGIGGLLAGLAAGVIITRLIYR